MSAGLSHGKLHLPLKPGKLRSLLGLGAFGMSHPPLQLLAVRLRMKSKLRTNLGGKGRTWILVDVLEELNQPALYEAGPSTGLPFV